VIVYDFSLFSILECVTLRKSMYFPAKTDKLHPEVVLRRASGFSGYPFCVGLHTLEKRFSQLETEVFFL